jgi:hypothetical protein
VHRDMLRRYLRCSASGTGAWYLQGEEATPPAIPYDRPLACTHTAARTASGLASAYGRVGPEGRGHCAACAGIPETTMHVYRHCPRYAAPRAHLTTRAVGEWYTPDGTELTPRPEARDRLGKTRCGGYTNDNAMGDGSCAPLAATLAGDVLRTAAYTFWKVRANGYLLCLSRRSALT